MSVHHTCLAIVLCALAALPSRAQSVPATLVLDGVSIPVTVGAPTTFGFPATPRGPWSAQLTSTRTSWVLERGKRRISLGLDPDRYLHAVHLRGGDAWLREFSRNGDDGIVPGRLVRVSPLGRKTVVATGYPTQEPSTVDVLCAERYWVAVMPVVGTIIYDTTRDQVVVHDRAAGAHARALAYRGPACSPDGRYVAVPSTHYRDVVVLRLEDGVRVARLGPELTHSIQHPSVPTPVSAVLEPGGITWHAGPHGALVLHPTQVNLD